MSEIKPWRENIGKPEAYMIMCDVLDVLCEKEAIKKAVYERLKQAPSTYEWIPCSERLPEPEKKRYWVCTDGGYQCQCRWTNINYFWTDLTTDWHWHIGDVPQYSKVVAWMPLPTPYMTADD